MIIRLPQSSEKYLGLTQLNVTNLMIESIQLDAQFLFTNLKRLNCLSTLGYPPLKALKRTIDLFMTNESKLDFINVDLGISMNHRGQLKDRFT
jgi:hypothetical protein